MKASRIALLETDHRPPKINRRSWVPEGNFVQGLPGSENFSGAGRKTAFFGPSPVPASWPSLSVHSSVLGGGSGTKSLGGGLHRA